MRAHYARITVASLVPLCKLIARYLSPTPPAILQMFCSVIDARTTSYRNFRALVAEQPDPELGRSNASHLHFISVLTEAFKALGGTDSHDPSRPSSNYAEELEQVLFSNQFAILDTLGDEESGQDEPSPGEQDGQLNNSAKEKGKEARRDQKKGKQISMEDYCFIRDPDGILTDQYLAISSIIYEWAILRDDLQDLWKEVAYGGLNSAIAAAVSNVAIGVIERSATAMSIDFPGQESYEALIQHITRGSLEKTQNALKISLQYFQGDKIIGRHPEPVKADLQEQFLLHSYDALVDFVSDFQKNRSGKPTKRMMKQIKNWNPDLDLGRATNKERLEWRRSYTINWLYDLVNVFSSPVVQRNTAEGEKHIVEEGVDWSLIGEDRRVLGLGNFASLVTRLAMQKQGTEFRSEILPHHVFQLQCMVDAMTTSRGWSILPLRGHVTATPPLGFRPRRDVDLFLDRKNENTIRGFLKGANSLKLLSQVDWQDCQGCIQEKMAEEEEQEEEEQEEELEKEMVEMKEEILGMVTPLELTGIALLHSASIPVLEKLHREFANWLGESKYMHGLPGISPSRFSGSNANGLWEYSPFLCGSGLAEALADVNLASLELLEQLPEAVLLVHLYNMLWHKQPKAHSQSGLYAELLDLFRGNFFQDGVIPGSNFRQAMQARLNQVAGTNAGVPKVGSYLAALRAASWEPDRVLDKDIPFQSCFLDHRLSLVKTFVDPTTGQKRLEETELVRKCKSMGFSEDKMVDRSTYIREALQNRARESSVAGNKLHTRTRASAFISGQVYDIKSLPFSGISYVYVMVMILTHWKQLEKELKDMEHPLYLEIYEVPQPGGGKGLRLSQQRLQLVSRAMETEDEACLAALEQALKISETPTILAMYVYWGKKTRTHFDPWRAQAKKRKVDQCSVM
ncbi:hypothetical protein B0T25DRAFT_624886 [Lasiosphaeria hispida]|uniref:DUF6604 domain-containing protein n=1 Tax=Lasiosphaeria hispida TaxID=260671 RepID=A0AAJ0HBU3_9PEZI|nr:hypothetical protein B0T25DRAFT_624886 [Lasiosphaeria hispida]